MEKHTLKMYGFWHMSVLSYVSKGEWLLEYEEMFDGKIKMTSDFACNIVGIVSIKLRTHDDRVCTLIEVRHVPLMSTKHLS